MCGGQAKRMKKRSCIILILIILFILLLIFFLWFFVFRNKTTSSTSNQSTMNTFFNAKTLHAKAKRVLTFSNGTVNPANDIEIWIDNGKIRQDISNNGQMAYTYISTDGVKVMAYNYKNHTKETSPADADYYLAGFQKPAASATDMGQDTANNCQKYDYSIDKTYNAAGSTYNYYLKNKVYCVGNNQVVYFKNYGDALVNGQKPTKLGEDYFKIDSIEINPTVASSVFQPPF